MEKIINLLINNWTKGVDTYTHNGSTWLIFTEQKSWVIELTESKTLWYNYNFFRELFSLTSMDVVDNQHYITKWVEDNIINKVNYTSWGSTMNERFVGDVIEDGVKVIEDVKHTRNAATKDTIKYGVRETGRWGNRIEREVEDTIQNGVKETNHVDVMKFFDNKMDDALENGVKETHDDAHNHKDRIDGVIKGGVKHTEIGWHQCNNIDDAIENGVKETLFNQGHKRLTVKNIIENGVRHTLNTEYMPTSMVEDIIQSGVKETKGHGFEQQNIIDDIVKDGVKETNHIKNNVRETKHFEEHLGNTIDDVINEGVKETKTPGDGDIMSTVEWMLENNSTSYPKMIDDVIENGEKINGTYVGGKRQKENIEVVIDYGVKETKSIGKESPNHPKVVINHIIQNGTKNPSV